MTHISVESTTVEAMTKPLPSTDSSSMLLPGQRMSGAEDWRPALSASRAKEYMKCPLQYRLHVIDGFKEPPTKATAKGTLVHSVLENLFDAAPDQRTSEHARSLLPALWTSMCESTPEVTTLFTSDDDHHTWMDETYAMVDAYFALEDPRYLEPAEREAHVVVETPDGIRLRGFIDRIDRAPNGATRVVDYKTGKAPSARFQEEALYQMRFYALLLQLSDALPARTQLLYLKSGQVLTFDPVPGDIQRFAHELSLLFQQIEADAHRGTFAPQKNPLCHWCGVKNFCPIFGGVTPPLPEDGIQKVLSIRASN